VISQGGLQTLARPIGSEVARMIIRRIQAIEPTEEQTEREKNNGRVQDSTHGDTDTQSARIKIVRHEDQNGHENAFIQLRRIYPPSPRP
jgi:hypothetical protein